MRKRRKRRKIKKKRSESWPKKRKMPGTKKKKQVEKSLGFKIEAFTNSTRRLGKNVQAD